MSAAASSSMSAAAPSEAAPLIRGGRRCATKKLGRVALGACVVVGALVVVVVAGGGASGGPRGVAQLSGDAEGRPKYEDVCLVHVATGGDWEEVSALTSPSKERYAAAHGYRMVPYVFETDEELPQCCAGSTTAACASTNVRYKYCALRDALLTGGAGSSAENLGGAACGWVLITDADAFIDEARAVALESLAPGVDFAVALSGGLERSTFPATHAALVDGNFNSGAMLWRNDADALALLDAVLAFDDPTPINTDPSLMACSASCDTSGGCGDQWALCAAVDADPSLLDRVVALSHPAQLQRVVFYKNGAFTAFPSSFASEWPPGDDEAGFVVSCAGQDELACVDLSMRLLG